MEVTPRSIPSTSVAARRPAWRTVVPLCGAAVLISYIDRTNISVAAIPMQAEFGWTETAKGWVLSSFFVGYLTFMTASGALANRYGGKLVLGAAVLWWSLFTALTPPAALSSFAALIGARIALGLGEAAVFPASINMIGRWVPAERRSRAVALFASALSVGTMISLPITGWLVRAYGWPVPFYAFGAIGIVWALAWFTMVSSGRSPDVEPPATDRAIPWRRILRSNAVWAIIIVHFCGNWSLYVLLAWLPSYFKTTFNVSLSSAGLLSAAPWLVYFVAGNVAGWVADAMIARGRSVTFVRKTIQIASLLGYSTFFLLLQLASTPAIAVLLMCGAAGTMALSLAGYAVNSFDIAPRHADVIWGVANSVATLPGIVGVAVTGWLIDRTGSFNAPFFLTAAVGLAGAIVYFVYASGKREIE
jgi:MFS transporter, ACS family, solute carrier family 17 (sodium-dependent inorganic phosphate cotransporter), other